MLGLGKDSERFVRFLDGKEKLEHISEAGGPVGFGMLSAFHANVFEINVIPPSKTLEGACERGCIAQMDLAFESPHVEPDSRAAALEAREWTSQGVEKRTLIPP